MRIHDPKTGYEYPGPESVVDLLEACYPLNVDTSDGTSVTSRTAWTLDDAFAQVLWIISFSDSTTRVAIRHTRFGDVIEFTREGEDWRKTKFAREDILTLRDWYRGCLA